MSEEMNDIDRTESNKAMETGAKRRRGSTPSRQPPKSLTRTADLPGEDHPFFLLSR